MNKQIYYFYANPFREKSIESARKVREAFKKYDAVIYAPRWLLEFIEDLRPSEDVPENCRAAIAFGGDGTLLRLAPMAAEKGVPMVGVHSGSIGFLMSASPDNPRSIAEHLCCGQYQVRNHPMLDVAVKDRHFTCLNDVTVTRGTNPGIMAVDVTVNGEKVYTPHGDGVILSTPLGSTAYAMAAGGPIVHPGAEVFLITPICARELLSRTVVVPLDCRVVFTVPPLPRDEAQLSIDGQTIVPLPGGEQVEITLSGLTAGMISCASAPFFDTLRRKTALWNDLS